MNKLLTLSAIAAVTCGAIAQTNLLANLANDEAPAATANALDLASNEVSAAATNALDLADEEEVEPAPAATNAGPVATAPAVASDAEPATAPADTTAPAATNAVPVAAATPGNLREQGTDEIDLEEIDDSAEAAAKRPTVKSDGDNVEYVDISCDEATLADILRQFRKTTKANIISDDSTNLQKRVSAELRHVPWLDALQSILNSRGFRLEKRGDIHFVNEEKRVDPVFTRSFQLNHASADDMAKLFNESYGAKDKSGKQIGRIANAFPEANVVVVTANEKTLSDCEGIIKAVDKAVAQIYIEARFLELSANATHALGFDWSSLADWGVTLKNLQAGFGHSEGQAANYGSGITSRSSSNNSSISDSDSQSSSASASSDGSSSTTASATPTKTTTTTSTGTDSYAGLFPNAIGAAANGAISAADMAWKNAFGYSGQLSADQFRVALSAFESIGEGKVFSNPKIIVANGKEALVDMTTKEPNVTVEANYTGTSSQNMNISTKLEVIPGTDKHMFAGEAFFSYGITLSVKPRISPDGLINVEIIPTISEFVENKEVKGATAQAVYTTYPKINVKRLTTNFTMQDGATAVIGGLTQTTEKDVDNGIPYLRRIPWIGQRLFGKISRQKVQSEIIVFVTVGIANPHELPKNVGLPTNAVLGREYVEGKRLEPGMRAGTAREVVSVDTRRLEDIIDEPAKPREEERRGTVTIKVSGKEEK